MCSFSFIYFRIQFSTFLFMLFWLSCFNKVEIGVEVIDSKLYYTNTQTSSWYLDHNFRSMTMIELILNLLER